jgi:hypothetical protein
MITMIKPAELKETTPVNFSKDGMNCSQVTYRTTCPGNKEARPENSKTADRINSKAMTTLSGFKIADWIKGQMICA